jgi:hypothetical protein
MDARSLRIATERLCGHPVTYIAICAALFAADVKLSRYLLFPIVYVIPVLLAAHFFRPLAAYLIAFLLPWSRFVVAVFVEGGTGYAYLAANAILRMIVFGLLAYFAARAARKTRELEQKVEGLVTMCAWSRTIEYEGEWISFEDYLQRRFGIRTSHGISPAEAAKLLPASGAAVASNGGVADEIRARAQAAEKER